MNERTHIHCRLASGPDGVSRAGSVPRWLCSLSSSNGRKHIDAKPLKHLAGGVLEVVSDHRGNTFRTVYTVKLQKAVYVLHVFQKKSKHGIATPKSVIDLVMQRLQRAIEIDREMEK